MKKLILFVSILLALSFVSKAQYTTSDIITADSITWYGLDFSNIKLIGSLGFDDPVKIKDYYFKAWNTLIQVESDKYNIAEFFHKDHVETNLDIITERNLLPDPSKLVIENKYSFGSDKVKEIIAGYSTDGAEGIGLVFIMESFNKNEEMGYMWVTFFNIENKEVLLTENFSGKSGGFGIRNYWAKSYYNVMKYIKNSVWRSWKKEFRED